ncbi:MAG TPA: 2Fe-2S iron-sulfur cluster-binding protein, partial [Rhodocyclaceae bacterium]|nr:2Fe-2S iron-sulfur cluster-binding protein [Rhodocyclaceae bacterium]
MSEPVRFRIDERDIEAQPGETILQAAQRHGLEIPHLCYKDGLRADGNCRACMVEIEGERTLAPSCVRMPREGMAVRLDSERVRGAQRMVLELLAADMPAEMPAPDNELSRWRERLDVGEPRFPRRAQPAQDLSHPGIAVRLDACIQCTRCLRACREVQANDVIGYAWRGAHAQIVFDIADPMGASSCVGCGECVQACPTGALLPATRRTLPRQADESRVDSLCPYCGVGCQVTYHVREGRIVEVEGRDGPANRGRLCVKGRYGFDYPSHPQRLLKPLIRRPGIPKAVQVDPSHPFEVFREASWEEALDFAAAGLLRVRQQHGKHALAGFGSAKGSNEEAYLFQKLVRVGFGTNNVDHCTR